MSYKREIDIGSGGDIRQPGDTRINPDPGRQDTPDVTDNTDLQIVPVVPNGHLIEQQNRDQDEIRRKIWESLLN